MAEKTAVPPIQKGEMKVNWVKVLGAVGSFVIFFIVWNLNIPDVSPQGKGALALLAACVVSWIMLPVPMAYSSIIAMMLAWVLGYVPMAVAMSGFAGTTFWLLIAAFGMGACIMESGLAKRIALSILSVIGKPTFKRVLAAVYFTMFLLGFLIPSVVAKSIALLAAFLPLVPYFGVKMNSNIGKSLVLSIVILGWVGNGVLPTAGLSALLVYGAAAQAGYVITPLQWALNGVLPVALIFIASYFFMLWYFKPEANEVVGGKEGIREQINALPKMSPKEVWALILTLSILIMWIIDPYLLKIGLAPIGVIGVLLYLIPIPELSSMSFSDFMRRAIPWEIMFLVGAILGISAMVPATGIAPILGKMLLPVLSIAKSPFGVAISSLVINLIMWPLVIVFPTIPIVTGPLIQAGAAVGLSAGAVAVLFVLFFPQFFYWAFATTAAMAFKDDVATLKEWTIVSLAVFAFTVIVLLLVAVTWMPFISSLGGV